MRRVFCYLLFLWGFSVVRAAAQEQIFVSPGDSVRIRLREGRLLGGALESSAPDSLSIRIAPMTMTHAWGVVDTLWVHRSGSSRGARRGAMVGALVGGLALMCGLAVEEGGGGNPCASGVAAGIAGAGLGALGGALLGAVLGSSGDEWQVRFVRPPFSLWGPTRTRGLLGRRRTSYNLSFEGTRRGATDPSTTSAVERG
jgi:hypothetical protein